MNDKTIEVIAELLGLLKATELNLTGIKQGIDLPSTQLLERIRRVLATVEA